MYNKNVVRLIHCTFDKAISHMLNSVPNTIDEAMLPNVFFENSTFILYSKKQRRYLETLCRKMFVTRFLGDDATL